jgi:hypothetical protein
MKTKGGRKSAASLSVVSEIADWRPSPPDVLSPAEAEMWRQITATKPSNWFDAASTPLLVEYCRLKTSVDILNGQLAKSEVQIVDTGDLPEGYKDAVSILDKKQGRMAQLAMKMRLTQQARYDKTKATTESKKAAPGRLWQRS